MVAWLGPAIAAGASLLGGVLGNKQRQEGQVKEMAAQKEFAQNGLRWRVADAEKAGIHPIYALGFNGPTYSPVGLGQNDTASSFDAAGQSFSRAIDATRTAPERQDAYTVASQKLSLERGELENTLLRAQIAQISRTPPFPMAGVDPYMLPGQGDSPVVLRNPFGLGETTVVTPQLGEEAEKHFSDVGGFVYGGGNMLESWVQSGRADMAKSIDRKYAGRPKGVPAWY